MIVATIRGKTARVAVAAALAASLALAAASGAAAGAAEPDAAKELIEQAAARLGNGGVYEFGFNWTTSGAGGEDSRILVGRARVEPLADGSSRYRVEAERPDGGGGGFIAVDDGEELRVLDRESNELWFSPRYRAAVFLSSRYLSSLLPLALSARSLADSARYRVEPGEPFESDGRPCDTARIPLPRGAWRLSFARGRLTPCRYELAIEGEEASLAVLEIRDLRPSEPPIELEIRRPAGVRPREFTPGGPAPGEAAPALELELPGGGAWSLAEQRGRVVLLDWWATWCVPCRPSMKAVETVLEGRPGQPIAALGLNYMDGAGNRPAFLAELGIGYPWAEADAAAADWGVDETGLPALFVVGKDGKLVDYFIGAGTPEHEQRLAETVDRALAAEHGEQPRQ